jgi:hypothetical protein
LPWRLGTVKVRTHSAATGTWSAWRPVTVTVARVAAWKLGLDGSDPTLTEGVKDGNFAYGSPVTCETISGHRDANGTACPGLIYEKLPAIRTTADQWTKPADLTSTSLTGATKVNSTSYTKGTVTLGWRPAGLSVQTGTVSSTKIPVSLTTRSVALIDKRTTTSGKLYVYVDGLYAATVDTRASAGLYRQVQWTRTWSTSTRHTIKIKVAGTSGRPTIALGGLAYMG